MSNNDDELQRLFDNQQLIERRRLGSNIDRDAWIAVSRRIFAPGEREPCYVCGKFRSIAQAHHVIPLTAQYDRGFVYPNQEFVWLCPNHHAMVHLYIPNDNSSITIPAMRARGRTTSALHEDLSDNEFMLMMELMHRSARSAP